MTAESSQENEGNVKLRAACDECRFKKLKCGGERPLCARCQRENIVCVYSPQHTMGRPKKRQRTDEGAPSTKAGTKTTRFKSMRPTAQADEATFDSGHYDAPFTPGGTVQPWLTDDWAAVPSLTPDNSTSHSESTFIPPLEMPANIDGTLLGDDFHLEPVEMSLPTGPAPKCACLSTLYLTLNTIQTMDESFAFPFALHPLREAMQTASSLLTCTECPTRFITGLQNTELLGTLLVSIAERFGKILDSISQESERATTAEETKKFRLADLSDSNSHLHTGDLGCAASFILDLSPDEWRSMTKKVVRVEVHGPANGDACCPYFMQLLGQMEERQNRWHKLPLPKDYPGGNKMGTLRRPGETKDGEHHCLKNAMFAKQLVEDLDWS
ncbi:unnamed protein product [Zymoseptoria tritici ST99CH_3D1]|nr:unnamed protein product [Zymoseptoria tritici ST99CH_3D1]